MNKGRRPIHGRAREEGAFHALVFCHDFLVMFPKDLKNRAVFLYWNRKRMETKPLVNPEEK